jgi:orotidine-5'-phosphate decarboxylase
MANAPLSAKDRLIVALDMNSAKAAKDAVHALKDRVGAFKIGFELFVSEGPSIVEMVLNEGGKVFLDLKFHDIPNTVARAARSSVRMGATFFDVHASGGRAMMEKAAEAAADEAAELGVKPPVTLAVTILTSLTEKDLKNDLNICRNPEDQVVSLAVMAKGCGMRGVVSSPKEAAAIRKAVGTDFIIVTPGVRPSWASTDDQKRFTTPLEAVNAGADYLVIGRPILKAGNPAEAAARIIEELGG